MKMGPKLKLKIASQGVHLPFGVEKKRAGSPPRLVEQFTSQFESKRKGLVLRLDLSSKKPALLNTIHLHVRRGWALSLKTYPFF
jgi:hypothetical protein